MNIPSLEKARERTKKEVNYFDYEIINDISSLGKGKKYYVRTYGCQMNEHDSENIKGMLESASFESCDSAYEADIIILNTCAIRENVHDKVFGFLSRLKHLKQTKTNLIIGIGGCMSQEEGVVEKLLKNYKFVDFVFGTHNLNNMMNLIKTRLETKERQIEVYSEEGDVCESIPVVRNSTVSAWVNIILGCDKFCTYCIVPYTRGKQRSRTKESIVEEIINLKNLGYKEVTLLGQNVNAYGKDLYEDYTLANLLKDVSDTGIERIRFVTSHPWDFSDEMIDVIAERENIMPYIHLPIQSGSNKMLKLMGRKYTKEDYILLYNKLKNKVNNSSITTDIIVGFPGETDDDFNETLDIVESCKFDGAFTYLYSPREGTPASKLENTLTEEEKKNRLYRLNKIVNKYSKEANQKLLGSIVKCLVTGISEKDNTKLCGYTENFKLVNIEGNKDLINSIVNVEITDAKSFSLDGKVVL